MRKIIFILPLLLGIVASAEAQPSWDIGASIGTFGIAPQTAQESYSDDWYFEGRYAVSIGKYWTDHIKTELEFAHSDEGSRYVQRFVDAPGVPPHYSIPGEEHNRLQQVSARLVYQFFDNAWVHPYVFGGVALDINRRYTTFPPNYYYPPVPPGGRLNPILVTPEKVEGPDTAWRPAGTFGAGSKMYLMPRAFFNAAVVTSIGDATRTWSLLAGFGVDF